MFAEDRAEDALSNDKQIPKLYSVDNNMDPGPVPAELIVSFAVVYLLNLANWLNKVWQIH